MSSSGIVIGEDKIIHFVNPKKDDRGFRARWFAAFMSSTSGRGGGVDGGGKKRKTHSCPISYCGQEKVAGSRVRLSCIDCFIKEKGFLYRYIYESDPPEKVIDRANDLYENWCFEHKRMNLNENQEFAGYCRTGLYSTVPTTVSAALYQLFHK
ncbi:hypothetical protein L6452_18227 [Arctium lappa]|uniref:Uncharacterized protein n=1 Tax=Arctium lappa TaxID=4217 RepID=A0ACB9C5M7_ARCLA|nr:hypothetical protein L6452_18227 [Arctium lappa]